MRFKSVVLNCLVQDRLQWRDLVKRQLIFGFHNLGEI